VTYEDLKASGKRFVLLELPSTMALFSVEKLNDESFSTMAEGRVVQETTAGESGVGVRLGEVLVLVYPEVVS
jgi:hypothetical protein